MATFGSKARGPISRAFPRASAPPVHSEELQTLADLLPRLEKVSERLAVLAFTKEGKQEWTYGQITQQASRLRGALGKLGIKKGDAVAFFAENGPEWFSTCLGVLAGGAVVVPLDMQLDEKALNHSLSDSGAGQVFTSN